MLLVTLSNLGLHTPKHISYGLDHNNELLRPLPSLNGLCGLVAPELITADTYTSATFFTLHNQSSMDSKASNAKDYTITSTVLLKADKQLLRSPDCTQYRRAPTPRH